jgi:transposase InsO family protein
MTAIQQYRQEAPARALLEWVGLSPSSYYYRSHSGPRGFAASTHTWTHEGTLVSNGVVVEAIKSLLLEEFVCYGYRKVTEAIHSTYRINHKKVYRLMKGHHLLYHQKIRVHTGKRVFVRYRTVEAQYPMQHLCMDIKYVYIHGEGRNAYLLTVLDIFTRRVLRYAFKNSIKQDDVVLMLEAMLQMYPAQGITVRNDNGSQFIATRVRAFLKARGILQEFTHVSTPEDNAYIEAFHSLLEREVISRYEFDSFYHADRTIQKYYRFYNEKRLHSALNYQTPLQAWNNFFKEQKTENHLNQIQKTVQSIGG